MKGKSEQQKKHDHPLLDISCQLAELAKLAKDLVRPIARTKSDQHRALYERGVVAGACWSISRAPREPLRIHAARQAADTSTAGRFGRNAMRSYVPPVPA